MIDARMLIVGEKDGIAAGWLDHLRGAFSNVSTVNDGENALRHLAIIEPEIILIDLRLPGQLDGFDTCRAIRGRSAAAVAIAATETGPYDEVVALAVGADHFLAADLPPELVVARLRALVRRLRGTVAFEAIGGPSISGPALAGAGTRGTRAVSARVASQAAVGGGTVPRREAAQLALLNGAGPDAPTECIVDGDLEIDLVAREVTVSGAEASLTRIEFDLLVTLARHPRRVFTREQLMASAWDEPFDGSHVLDAHLSRMRGKISAAGGGRVAHAVRGVGYRLRS